MLENIFDAINSNSIYIAILAMLGFILIYALIKKIIKLIFIISLILFGYVFYLNQTGQDIPKSIESLKKSVSDNVEVIKGVATESIDEAKKTTRKIVEDQVGEKIDEILD